MGYEKERLIKIPKKVKIYPEKDGIRFEGPVGTTKLKIKNFKTGALSVDSTPIEISMINLSGAERDRGYTEELATLVNEVSPKGLSGLQTNRETSKGVLIKSSNHSSLKGESLKGECDRWYHLGLQNGFDRSVGEDKPPSLRLKEGGEVIIVRENERSSQQGGLKVHSIATCLENIIRGVSRGFLVNLQIIGVGYKASLEEKEILLSQKGKKSEEFSKIGVNETIVTKKKQSILALKLGFSHDIKVVLPSSVGAFCPKPTQICLYGIDFNEITQFAAKIRNIKPPEVYKGKGIRFKDEIVTLKEGKKK
uniref:Ribosomal protein L6 n=1 Tax=Chlorokybus atmophyticus TaxID=3144 RepID=A6YEB9_CHLAT|nr:ribosomal protein L6 [Chlorokybus atmophyticus]ABO15113.1 ribosomal protein L6 [Chlorokybus atmophyticus]